MLNQFQKFLINKGYKEFSANGSPSTVIDYTWRLEKICLREGMTEEQLEKICLREGMTEEQLADNITTVLKQYDKSGDKWFVGRRSHESYINALKQFRKFVLVQRFGGANA